MAAAVVGLAVVWFWFQPQKLLFDTVVDEEFPVVEPDAAVDLPGDTVAGEVDPSDAEGAGDDATAADDGPGDDATAAADEPGDDTGAADAEADPEPSSEPAVPAEPVALATGGFDSRNRYTVTGTATYYELQDGSRTLRLEDFASTNGPDLYVYLTSADSADSDAAMDADVVDLGPLSGNIGNQNYVIPDEVDLDRYDTVLIWCLPFSVGFGAADLAPS